MSITSNAGTTVGVGQLFTLAYSSPGDGYTYQWRHTSPSHYGGPPPIVQNSTDHTLIRSEIEVGTHQYYVLVRNSSGVTQAEEFIYITVTGAIPSGGGTTGGGVPGGGGGGGITTPTITATATMVNVVDFFTLTYSPTLPGETYQWMRRVVGGPDPEPIIDAITPTLTQYENVGGNYIYFVLVNGIHPRDQNGGFLFSEMTVLSILPQINPTISIDESVHGKSTITFSFSAIQGATIYKLFAANNLSAPLTTSTIPYGNTINIIYVAEGYKGTTQLYYYLMAYDNTNTSLTEQQPTPLLASISCLPRGTRVLTPSGYRLVEEIDNGELITTDDGRNISVITHRSSITCSNAKSAPIQIAARSFFGEYPVAPIRISPWHAFKVGSDNKWLLPKDVIGIDGVVQEPFGQTVEYYHFELPNYLSDNLVIEGGAVVESYGIPWKKFHGVWNKATYIMDKTKGYASRCDLEEMISKKYA